MVRERKDYYQITKAVGGNTVLETPVVGVETEAPVLEVGALAVEAAGKRKKKKAHKSRSTTEVEVETEVELDAGPETEVVSEGPDGSSKKRTARDEVTPASFISCLWCLCTSTNHYGSL